MNDDNENEKEDLRCFLNEDSSVEDELLRVAEKLETMQRREEEEVQKVTFLTDNDVPKFSLLQTVPCVECPESSHHDCAPDSSPIIPASLESHSTPAKDAKRVGAVNTTDHDIRSNFRDKKRGDEIIEEEIFLPGDGKEERRGLQRLSVQNHISCSAALLPGNITSTHENRTEENTNEQNVIERHEARHIRSPRHNEKEKTPPSQSRMRQVTATVKATLDEKEGTNHKNKDIESTNSNRSSGKNEDGIDDNNSAFATEFVVFEHVADNEDQKNVFENMTTIGTTRSNDDLDSSDCSNKQSVMTNRSDSCASFSATSSISSTSDEAEELVVTEMLQTNETSEKTHTTLRRQDLSPQWKSQLQSLTGTTSSATHDSKLVERNSSISGVATPPNYAKGTNQTKMIEIFHGTPFGNAQKKASNCTTKDKGPGKSWEPVSIVRNPYLRKRSINTDRVNEAESTLAHDLKNEYSSPKTKNTFTVENCDSENGNMIEALQSEFSEKKKRASLAPRHPIDAKRQEFIVVDRQELAEGPESEVSRVLFAPPDYCEGRTSPILHRFDHHSYPVHSRQTISVGYLDRLFTPTIVNSFWGQKFDRFNHFQSTMVKTLSESDNNVVVSAPTGAGKSTIFEMAMARFLAADLRAQEQQDEISNSTCLSHVSKARKMVYIAPSKALCEERYRDWSRRFDDMNLDLRVALITGQEMGSEQATNSFADLCAAHLIVTTPEKWDSMTRRWNESFFLFASIKLLLLDEVHLLGDESRGWCLESIVIRMKTIQRAASALITTPVEIGTSSYTETNPDAINSCFRTVAVSATLPNISEVADFLQANEAYYFDDSYRPVPLTKHVNALGSIESNEWRFWSSLSEHVPEIIKRFAHGKQALIFCHSKKDTQKVAELLIRRNFGNRGVQIVHPPWKEPVEYMIAHGVGYHHAGMSKDERKTIEGAFLKKKIKFLAATSTLAVGVNFPAHLVIIVGTKAYRNNEKGKGYQEIEVSALLQMVGRAGRPGLDSTGVAVVLTDYSSKKRIENLLEAGIGEAKSNLVPRLPEVLNTEISQRVIASTEETLRWLQTTFLFSCLKQSKNSICSMQKLGNDAVMHLREIGVVETSEQLSIRPLAGSFIMNRYMVSFEEMKSIISLPFDASQCQILRSISKLNNFQSFVKRNEKRELKEFHKSDLMKYKLPGLLSKFIVKHPSEKAFILLQSHVSRHRYENEMLNEEQITIRDKAIKFLEVAQEYCVKASKHGKVALECYKLQRSLNCSLWGESSGVFNQFDWICSSKTASNALAFNGIRSFQDVLDLSQQKLDEIFAKIQIPDLPKNAGRIVKHTARDLCRRRLSLSIDVEYTKNSSTPTDVICSLKYHDPALMVMKEEGEQDLKFSLIAYTSSFTDSSLMFEQNICSPSSFRVPLPPCPFQKLFVHLVGSWVGFDQVKVIDDMVSSHESARILESPKVKSLRIDSLASAKMKKRKRCEIEESYVYSMNQRQNEIGFCTEKDPVKKPSPITPQTKDKNSGIAHAFLTSNQQFYGGFCEASKEASKEAHETVQPTTLPLTPGRSGPLIQPRAEMTSSSINITPTTRLPKKKTVRYRRSSSSRNAQESSHLDFRSNFADYNLCSSTTEQGSSGVSCLEKNCVQSARGQGRLEAGEMHPFVIREASAVDKLPKEKGEAREFTYDEPRRATENSDNAVSCSFFSPLRQGKLEKMVWNQSRSKQQRSQKRAFTEKKMNPFSTFSYDPNDFERHLEKLSHQSSIIPNPLLAKLKQTSIASNRKSQSHFPTDRRHSARTSRHRFSNASPHQVLREKAFEQQFHHEKMMMSYQKNTPKHMPSEHSPRKTCCMSQSPHLINTRQSIVGPNRKQRDISNCKVTYTQNVDGQSHFPESLVSSRTPNFPLIEESSTTYQTILGNHYQPYERKLLRSSNTIQPFWDPQVRTFEEYGEHLHTNSFGSSYVDANAQSQHQHLAGRKESHHQTTKSPVDFEMDFHDAFC